MYVHSGTRNGMIIEWRDPVTNTAVFEWDEDISNTPHYHAKVIAWDNLHNGIHYEPGTPVPEPLNSIYFGE